MTLEERVRNQIGEEGPQLESAEYQLRVDMLLRDMCCAELLTYISGAMENMLADIKAQAEEEDYHRRIGEDM